MGYHRRKAGSARAVLAIVVAAAFLSTCDTLGLGNGPRDELSRNRELWARIGPSAYEYALERRCFCGEAARGPIRVTVEVGAVVERVYVGSGDPVPASFDDLFPVVDGLFDVLEDAYERDAHQIDVTYDPETGVPIDFWIDYSENTIDEELGYTVTEPVHQLP
jgi:hypothetical protein